MAVEINANPIRLDLDWTWCKRAKALGVTLVVNPDAHSTAGLADVRHGIDAARRGWVEAPDVLNARHRPNLLSEEDGLVSQWGEPVPQEFITHAIP